MTARDPHRFVNELDDAAVERLVARLEGRAKDRVFTRLLDKYAAKLKLPASARVLEIGCGTGAVARALASQPGFSGKIIGIDHSLRFLDAARNFAQQEGVAERVEFRIGDAHRLEFPDASFDAAVAHTVISHVTEPEAVLRELARVVRPGGTVVVFDGDYASLTYALPDHELGRRMDRALAAASFNNPLVMRDLPRLLPELGLTLTAAWGDAVTEIGAWSFFKSFAETYAPAVAGAGLMPAEAVDAWLAAQRAAAGQGTFFASCNYYTYLTRRGPP
jgi:SAM-dependent methyltransferase